MIDMINHYLPWLISVVTVTQLVLTGNLYRWSWVIGIANQALWLTWIWASSTWGMIPMVVALVVVFTRNHLKWLRNPPHD